MECLITSNYPTKCRRSIGQDGNDHVRVIYSRKYIFLTAARRWDYSAPYNNKRRLVVIGALDSACDTRDNSKGDNHRRRPSLWNMEIY